MARPLVSMWIVLIAAPLLAQQRPPSRIPTSPGLLSAQIDRMESDVRGKASALRRDAFIVAQVTAAVGELDDFQRSVAIDKAKDHVDQAMKRAGENPVAPRSTFEFLQSQRDLISRAKLQGSTADLPALKRDMLKGNQWMQQTLFSELDDVRKDRQTLSDLQSRLSSITNDLDNALTDALGSTFDYFRAGGR
jgi:hypothetical protein